MYLVFALPGIALAGWCLATGRYRLLAVLTIAAKAVPIMYIAWRFSLSEVPIELYWDLPVLVVGMAVPDVVILALLSRDYARKVTEDAQDDPPNKRIDNDSPRG